MPDDEIRAAQRQRAVAEAHPLTEGHGIHAFVFLSFIFAETLKLIIEAWIEVRQVHPEVIFLIAITLLTVQYWWVIFESAFFYGKNIFNFACGTLETALFYAIAYLIRNGYALRWSFLLFGIMVLLFLFVDLLRYFEYFDKDERTKTHIAPRQILRIIAIILSVFGALCYINPHTVAGSLLLLAIVYTLLTSYARSQTVSTLPTKAEAEKS